MCLDLSPEKERDYSRKHKGIFLYHHAIYWLIYQDKVKVKVKQNQ
ncbi:hypothetical protein Phpb_02835 [Photorhabdus namnaonensis]|uniref:Uncharacterized protein n=1 Tax=Photorhabdus namnaonensis TaxID=1851568 RepID=A0A1B8YGW5_9GAMM|nr:hypothetical protein Phpb_02835 [Photorhabdus namnaonensis]